MKIRRVFTGLSFALCCTPLLLAPTGCDRASAEAQPAIDPVKRGEYLVTTIGCGDCHTPKVMTPRGPAPKPDFILGGHPATQPLPAVDKSALSAWALLDMSMTATVGPWGASYAANISSDETGIGNWTETQFFTAMRNGKSKGLETGRPLLPPMPWENYAQLSDEDLRAIFAYLKSTKPVRNVPPPPTPVESL